MDDTDRQLVAMLLGNARLPVATLAKSLGVSRGTVQNRIDRLTARGTIQGFTIEGCEGTAVVVHDSDCCLIAGNTIRNVGDYNGSGVSVDGGTENGVAGNDILEVGSHGISIGGGDRKTLTAAGNYADNNYIHHFGVYYNSDRYPNRSCI